MDDKSGLRRTLYLLVMFAVWIVGTGYFVFLHGHQWAIFGVTVAALALTYLPYLMTARKIFRKPVEVPRLKQPASQLAVKTRLEDFYPTITVAEAGFFMQMLLRPAQLTQRIGERVKPATRSYSVSTSYSILIPNSIGNVAVIPLMLVRKGHLLDRFKVENASGARYSTLAQEQSIAYTAAVIRKIVEQCGPVVVDAYKRDCEDPVLSFLARPGDVPTDDGNYVSLRTNINNLSAIHPGIMGTVLAILSALERQYPVVIVDKDLAPQATPAPIAGYAQLRVRVERQDIPALRDAQGFSAQLREFINAQFGIRPATLYWPIDNSLRAQSYHLETEGPPSFYLASQRLIDAKTRRRVQPNAAQSYCLPRAGQRYSHLYISGRREMPPRKILYVAKFYERPAGSIAPAAVSAFASLAILIIAACYRLSDRNTTSSDLVAILLAVPAVASAWSGFEVDRSIFGGTVGSRFAQITTMLLSLTGAALYLLWPRPTEAQLSGALIDRPGARLWIAVISLSAYCFLHCALSWLMRSSNYNYFVNRSEEELYPSA